jgi:hypothetical protein
MEEKYCSVISEQLKEPLFGSAGQTDTFFLLEYNGPWEDKALEKSPLPSRVKEQLSSLAKALPAAKNLLIKRSAQATGQPGSGQTKNFFIALAGEGEARLYHFELSTYEELLELDLPGLLAGQANYDRFLQPDPLYLVCTNGRRDLCCARFGFSVYQALREQVGESVWECSHVGGHRFAANVYHLPDGVLYGRIRLPVVPGIVTAIQAGQLRLENLRGRTIYPQAVQAADYYLRRQSGEVGLDAYRLTQAIELGAGHWRVGFTSTTEGTEHDLEIMLEKSDQQVFESCTLDKPTSIVRYKLLTIT